MKGDGTFFSDEKCEGAVFMGGVLLSDEKCEGGSFCG